MKVKTLIDILKEIDGENDINKIQIDDYFGDVIISVNGKDEINIIFDKNVKIQRLEGLLDANKKLAKSYKEQLKALKEEKNNAI